MTITSHVEAHLSTSCITDGHSFGNGKKPLPPEKLLEGVLSKWRLTSKAVWQGTDIGSICKVVQSDMFILGGQTLDSNSKKMIWQDIFFKEMTFDPIGAHIKINQTRDTKIGRQSTANLIAHLLLSQTPTALNWYLNIKHSLILNY